jgi:hypothetical protein
MRVLTYAVLLVMIFAGCQKESKINLPYNGDKIVINSLIQPDSLIYIRVTKSKPVKESGNLQFPELSDAVITLSADGVVLPAPHWVVIKGRGYFVSEHVAEAGKHYSISVMAEKLEDASASDTTPARPLVRNIQTQRAINRIRFTVKDDAAKADFYRIRFYNADSLNGVLVKNKKDTVKCRIDPAFSDNFIDLIGNTYYSEVLVSDERINGKDFEFVMQTENEISSQNMIVEVSALTGAAYKYLVATDSQRSDDDVDFFFDLTNIYSNVLNGYGIVAGVNATEAGFKAW